MNRTVSAALDPVRETLLASARRDADRVWAQADAEARRALATSEELAEKIRTEARDRGAADLADEMAAERSRAGRRARELVLRARVDEYDALRLAAKTAVAALPDDPDYPRLRDGLVDVTRTRLGPDVCVHEGDGGGVIGEVRGRRLDYSLASFADRAVDALLADVDQPSEPRALAPGRGATP
jgi:vacuolar-type H+-ATPase subunit E/Vma4